ncbi:39S ribosomal protein L1, mitochondrial [Toxorhynchites rutilus septentrionalis]|uniref:39S ribosomal protein L1, mitochondrial n=1 Tax=Toxorhynchites rutilus septentrionalis TaxID=329112 RepID=UPI002478FAB4|nr:39S ribosomal protein L1, mitochondrial [Toxorhynchites rutilus septentrionalis]
MFALRNAVVSRFAIPSALASSARLLQTAAVDLAARKGTREKARKNKVKKVVEKVGFIRHDVRKKGRLNLVRVNKHIDDSWKQDPVDDCWVGKYYKWRVYSIEEAIQCHRETHHPTMYNLPNAPLHAHIELNMQAEKITRFVDNFQRMVAIPHSFEHGENRNVIVFAKGQEILKEATDAGAALVGGIELIKEIQNGDLQLSEYPFVLAHPNILPDLVVIRGLLKKNKFPNPKQGTLGTNLAEMIEKYSNGIQYYAQKDEYQKDYGSITTCIGTLEMDSKHLEDNLVALLNDIDSMRPKRAGKFITRVLLKSPPSGESLKIDPFLYVSTECKFSKSKSKDTEEDVDEVEHERNAVVVSN